MGNYSSKKKSRKRVNTNSIRFTRAYTPSQSSIKLDTRAIKPTNAYIDYYCIDEEVEFMRPPFI